MYKFLTFSFLSAWSMKYKKKSIEFWIIKRQRLFTFPSIHCCLFEAFLLTNSYSNIINLNKSLSLFYFSPDSSSHLRMATCLTSITSETASFNQRYRLFNSFRKICRRRFLRNFPMKLITLLICFNKLISIKRNYIIIFSHK